MKQVTSNPSQVNSSFQTNSPQGKYMPVATGFSHRDTIAFSKAEQHGGWCGCLQPIWNCVRSIFRCLCSCFCSAPVPISSVKPALWKEIENCLACLSRALESFDKNANPTIAVIFKLDDKIDFCWIGKKHLIKMISGQLEQELSSSKFITRGAYTLAYVVISDTPDTERKTPIFETADYQKTLESIEVFDFSLWSRPGQVYLSRDGQPTITEGPPRGIKGATRPQVEELIQQHFPDKAETILKRWKATLPKQSGCTQQ
jgi:hypothetical protein